MNCGDGFSFTFSFDNKSLHFIYINSLDLRIFREEEEKNLNIFVNKYNNSLFFIKFCLKTAKLEQEEEKIIIFINFFKYLSRTKMNFSKSKY